jgi:MHS family proline/betaine transporter-like MFS transporter
MGAVLGGAGSPYVATWLIDRTGDTMVPAYMLVLFGVIGLALVSLTVRGNADSRSHLYR